MRLVQSCRYHSWNFRIGHPDLVVCGGRPGDKSGVVVVVVVVALVVPFASFLNSWSIFGLSDFDIIGSWTATCSINCSWDNTLDHTQWMTVLGSAAVCMPKKTTVEDVLYLYLFPIYLDDGCLAAVSDR